MIKSITCFLITALCVLPGISSAVVTVYTDEANYRSALASLGYDLLEESFENESVWGGLRSPLSVSTVNSQGITWRSNNATSQIRTSGGAAHPYAPGSNIWGFFSIPHGDYDNPVPATKDCTLPNVCTDGFIATRSSQLYGIGGWFGGTPGGQIDIILDNIVVDFGDGTVTQMGNEFKYFAVIDTAGFTRVEIRETEGKTEDRKFIFTDSITFAVTAGGGNPDSDGDGVPDNQDAFPNDPTETTDSDGDGVGNNSDAFPNDPTEWADSDGDGIGDNSDPFPNDPDNGGGTWVPVTTYLDGYAGNSADWSYFWNRNGVIGNTSAYTLMAWNGSFYNADGLPVRPSTSELRWGYLSATGGHPGWGSLQGAASDRYVIAAYTTNSAGNYRITNSTATQASCVWSNGLDLRVFVNDTQVLQRQIPADGSNVSFDTVLGNLAAGARVYFAVGPDGRDGCDGFTWNFSLERETASSGQTWLPVTGFQTGYQAQSPSPGWTYSWNANGAIGTAANTTPLLWSGVRGYDSDGIPGRSLTDELSHGFLSATGGHAGQGVMQGTAADRYLIATYETAVDGEYRLSNSRISQTGCQWTNGLDIQVLVNDTTILQQPVAGGGGVTTFDTLLGRLINGDRISVGVGPNGSDGCDRFTWDYEIEHR